MPILQNRSLEVATMRGETVSVVNEIEQAIGLLRRHL
jgi:hypothetical protein